MEGSGVGGGGQEEMKRDTDDKTKQSTDTLKRDERHAQVLGSSTQMGRRGHRKERATHARKIRHRARETRGERGCRNKGRQGETTA